MHRMLAGLCVFLSLVVASSLCAPSSNRSFYIDFANDTFVRDGAPFRYVSGSIHPYRVPHELWHDRLAKMWAAGLNAIQVYIFWNEHEPQPGVYDFAGQRDIASFLRMAGDIGFVVLLRPGPYVCAEHDFGGLPWWLLADHADTIVLRSSDELYLGAVRRWFDVLLPTLTPLLYKNGGPIVTVQIENEYGSYYTCDRVYTTAIRDQYRKILGDDVIYYTTDGNSVGYLKCGTVPGALATVDFGTGADVASSFAAQRVYLPHGPLVNSEYYVGWLDFWGSPHQKVSTSDALVTFHQMMQLGANVNIYMFHGGTNWGFSNGADPTFSVQPTSYDYDAPISESGDITNKYLAFRDAISQYLPLPPVDIPDNSSKVNYGQVSIFKSMRLTDAVLKYSSHCQSDAYPLSFERLGQGYGFLLYMTQLEVTSDLFGTVLSMPGVRDRAYIQLDDAFAGVIYRTDANTSLTINVHTNATSTAVLYVFVENMGRLNYGDDLLDVKGLVANVTLGGRVLANWTTCRTDNFVPNYQSELTQFNLDIANDADSDLWLTDDTAFDGPTIHVGEFFSKGTEFDTFLDMSANFTKGVALIQSDTSFTNLGRYWPKMGPQVTLYTPGVFTTAQVKNYVVLIEFEGSSCLSAPCSVDFIDYPIIDSI